MLIGLLVLGGVQKFHNENLNELRSPSNDQPIFRAIMSKNRMNNLLKFYQFYGAAIRNAQTEDKLVPVSELWAMFFVRLQTFYILNGFNDS